MFWPILLSLNAAVWWLDLGFGWDHGNAVLAAACGWTLAAFAFWTLRRLERTA